MTRRLDVICKKALPRFTATEPLVFVSSVRDGAASKIDYWRTATLTVEAIELLGSTQRSPRQNS